MPYRYIFGLLMLIGLVTDSTAGTIINLGGSDPTGLIEQHVAANRTARAQRDTPGTGANERIFGQTFYAPADFLVEGLALKTSNARDFSSLSPTTLQVKIFDMDAGTDDPETGLPDSDNVLLDTFDFDVSSLSYGANEWLQFKFDRSLSLAQDELYGFLVFWDGDSTDNTFDVRHTGPEFGDQIPGIMRWNANSYDDADWPGANPWRNAVPDANNADLTFVVFAVPEPSTLLLVIAGLLGMVFIRKK